MKDQYLSFLTQNKLKNTAQRQALFSLIMKEKEHFTLENIQKKIQGNIGIATLYRFLRLMIDSHLINEYHFSEKTVFETAPSKHHDHLICTKCTKIVEFLSSEIENAQKKIAQESGFLFKYHKHELYGLCPKCQKKEVRS